MGILPILILMLGVIGMISFLAPKVAIPAPVLLAVAGVVWSLIPSLPSLEIAPGVILAVFLPPLLYADAWEASWIDFRRWLRPILQLAIGLVAFTILAVGLVAHRALPGLPWAACFLLGAIVSPTDTVAVHAVLERLRVPRRLTAILGGESLVNDATGLLGAGLATAVVLTGVFEGGRIASSFARIAGFGIVIGAAVGLAAATLNYFVRGTQVLFVFSLLAPYAAYFLAEHAGASGVLAVVIAGFVASWRIHYIAPESRVELYSSWEQLAFLLNALMFLYIGLEAPDRLKQAIATVPGVIGSALWIGVTVIVARFVWVFPGAYVPLWLSPRLRQREGGYASPRGVMLASWCGVRGAVSLAAALSVPATLMDGTPFPGRAEIIACTLVVILVTLIGQGVTLLPLVRRLGLSDADPTDAEVRRAHEAMLAAGITRLDAFCSQESCPIAVYRLRDAMSDQLASLQDEDAMARAQALRRLSIAGDVRRAVYRAQTDALLTLRDQGVVNDRVHQELQLDLDRANIDLRAG
ncbi:MAG: Na+/H+ antiporter [Acidobacteria bacterium 13_1_40CM_2_68_5]|nr:MAG: Na+/H+ antiporter [Acidobacteria bacterium 13_1_40CM_2_68_5]